MALVLLPTVVLAATLVSETFANATAFGWTATGSAGAACLTAGQVAVPGSIPACPAGAPGGVNGTLPDRDGQGALRLTTNDYGQRSFVLFDTAVPSGQGFVITFDAYTYDSTSLYGGNGGDGFSFFLIDGGVTPSAPGAPGGALGYAQLGGQPGIAGGYLGVGFDEFGSYSNDNGGQGVGCPNHPASEPFTVTWPGFPAGDNVLQCDASRRAHHGEPSPPHHRGARPRQRLRDGDPALRLCDSTRPAAPARQLQVRLRRLDGWRHEHPRDRQRRGLDRGARPRHHQVARRQL